ncbi:MAG: type III pantothenate kinase [Bacteroidales bacterium]|nr:type III pantothenate kinase [Bacteroidales bacterium]
MYLAIDIGNTSQKLALFDQNGRQCQWLRKERLTPEDLQQLFSQYPVRAAILSSVGDEAAPLEEFLKARVPTYRLTSDLQLPVTLCYATPASLGADRIASAAGAHALFPDCNVLVVQAGTCLVTDLVTAAGQYLGGTIAPGLRMRLRALPQFTAHLPLLDPEPVDYLVGNSTAQSILSGVVNGYVCEIQGMISRYETQYPGLKVVLSGGDAPLLESSLKNSIFAAQNLVLLGLYEILHFNVSET